MLIFHLSKIHWSLPLFFKERLRKVDIGTKYFDCQKTNVLFDPKQNFLLSFVLQEVSTGFCSISDFFLKKITEYPGEWKNPGAAKLWVSDIVLEKWYLAAAQREWGTDPRAPYSDRWTMLSAVLC